MNILQFVIVTILFIASFQQSVFECNPVRLQNSGCVVNPANTAGLIPIGTNVATVQGAAVVSGYLRDANTGQWGYLVHAPGQLFIERFHKTDEVFDS